MEERRYAGDAAGMQGMQMSYQTFSLSLVSFVFEAQQTARDSYCPDVDMKSESAASRTSHTNNSDHYCRDPVDPSRSCLMLLS